MLNIGPPELLLIIVIALVVVGPQRLPDLGRTIGRGLREFRKVQDEVRDMVDTGLDDDLKQTAAELRQTASDLRSATDVRSAFRNTPHRARQRAAAAVTAAASSDEITGDPGPPADADAAASTQADAPADATQGEGAPSHAAVNPPHEPPIGEPASDEPPDGSAPSQD